VTVVTAELQPEVPPWRPVPDRPLPPTYPRVPPSRPERATPQPPLPPHRTSFPFVPFPPDPSAAPADVWTRLLERRIVMVSGPLDNPAATRAAAEVMLLDADGDGPIQLHLSSPDGDLDAAIMLAETVDLLQVPVQAIAGGLIGGPVIAVYASAGRRLAHRHVAFHLREPSAQMEGNAEQLAGRIAQHQHQIDYLHRHVAESCGRSVQAVAEDMAAGRLLTAAAAIEYGLVHELTGREGPPATG
jgi:ATP-dependent Clp protease protease subunit